jgi:hypothetical protein
VIFRKKELEALRTALAALAGMADRLEARCALAEESSRHHESRADALCRDLDLLRTDLQELRRLVHGALMDPESEHAQIKGVAGLLRNETEELPETDEWKQAQLEQRQFVTAWNALYADICPIAEPPPEETQD